VKINLKEKRFRFARKIKQIKNVQIKKSQDINRRESKKDIFLN